MTSTNDTAGTLRPLRRPPVRESTVELTYAERSTGVDQDARS